MSVTLEDISKATGFSIPTVSRVLSNSRYPVNSVTRQRILEVAQALGYRPNLAARGLRTERTNTLGILVDDVMSPFVPPIVRGIQDYLMEHGFSCLIVNSDWNPDLEHAAIESLLSQPYVRESCGADAALRTSSEPGTRSGVDLRYRRRADGAKVGDLDRRLLAAAGHREADL